MDDFPFPDQYNPKPVYYEDLKDKPEVIETEKGLQLKIPSNLYYINKKHYILIDNEFHPLLSRFQE